MKPKTHFKQIDAQERIVINLGLEQGLSMRAIARMLNRPACTVSREIQRNSGGAGYSCTYAQQRRNNRRVHSRPAAKLVAGNALFESVRHWLHLRWSPSKLQRIWLNCTLMRQPSAPVMKLSTTLSTPNPEESSNASW
jgi:IS30 family transposase